jgi:hypothetical protein
MLGAIGSDGLWHWHEQAGYMEALPRQALTASPTIRQAPAAPLREWTNWPSAWSVSDPSATLACDSGAEADEELVF